MMGYWHIVALSAAFAAVSVILETNLFIFLLVWLAYLYVDERINWLFIILPLLSFLFFFNYFPVIDEEPVPPEIPSESQSISGKIISAPVIQQQKMEAVVEEHSTEEKILVVYFPDEDEKGQEPKMKWRHGAECVIEGKMEIPHGATNPGEFDYREYLLKKGISKQLTINSPADMECERASFMERFFSLRYDLIHLAPERISAYTAAWLNALVFGDDSMIDEHVTTLFQDWGLSHILAISGLHIGIIVGLLYLLLVKSNIMTKEKAELSILLFLPVYAILAGGAPSVWRASLMVGLVLFLHRLNKRLMASDVISIVFLGLLVYNPYYIYHIGFQFSFIVTFSIILSRKWLSSTLSPLFQLLIISFISQMIILPLQLDYFGLFQPLSILLNLIIVPYFSVFVIPFMFLLLIFSFLPDRVILAFDLLFVGIHHQVLEFIGSIDEHLYYPLYLSEIPLWFYLLYYATLFAALSLTERNHLKGAFYSFLVLIMMTLGQAALPYVTDDGAVTMLDIGQGDAFIIDLPYRRGVVMIDAGSTFSFDDMEPSASVYERIIKPFLRREGIYEIDALFLTHEDIDHIGSLEFLLDDGLVKDIYVSNYFEIPSEWLPQAQEKDVGIHRVQAGDVISIDEVKFTVLGPLRDKAKSNENSLVLYTEVGGKSWLFTGDIGKEEERELTGRYKFVADIIKVAHHGSNTSSDPDFLRTMKSQTALIPVGRNNAYGHPAKEVTDLLEELGITVYRTDQNGAVQYFFNRNGGFFKPFLPTISQ